MLFYLYRNRIRPSAFSKAWIKVWTKRAFHFPATARIALRSLILKVNGALIDDLSVIHCRIPAVNACRLKVGRHTYIAPSAHLALHDDISIGSAVVINAGVKIYTASHEINDPQWPIKKQPISIADYAWIASDAILLPGVSIGYGAVVGAGAVVSRSVPDYHVVAGNPATTIKIRSGPFHYSPTAFTSPIECWLGAEQFIIEGHAE